MLNKLLARIFGAAPQRVEPAHPNCSTTLGPLGCNRVRCNLGKKCIAAVEAAATQQEKSK